MEKLISGLDKLLGLIPFNGDKTVVGAGLKLMLPILVLKMPVLVVVGPALDLLAEFLISAGLAHKAIKAGKKKE
jgi:hypothetical protein